MMIRQRIKEIVGAMSEETELAYMEEIIKKRRARLEEKKGSCGETRK